ncbi:MAG: DUF1329 domain-containing protein [Gammaproteobacteria bacterium]|nr:DUF1329 domain-containing protein [Gammaproteobacteria bacterium]
MQRFLTAAISFLVVCLICTNVSAAISAEEAAALGGDKLTPMGAEKAGNEDGTIPEWTGGMKEPPAGYKAGEPLIDPFPDDQPLFTITAKNFKEYADKLSPGQIAVLKRYPDTAKMPVFKTRRTAAYPESVYKEVKAGAVTAEMVGGGNGLKNIQSDFPFPIPKSGLEVVWNHILRYRGGSLKRIYTQIPVQTNGAFSPVVFEDQITWGRVLEGAPPNRLFFYKQTIKAPARLEGDVLLVHENIDQVAEPRAAWIYNAGQRRVRRAPDVAYDGPGTASDGLRTADDLDLFNGAPDRYDWKLIGKQELYIPYNSYRIGDKKLKYSDIIMPGHINPDYLRYELHRVWVVEATLKPGERHIYGKRVFYVDEDQWQIAVADQYDGRGELWRVKEAHAMTHYHVKVPWSQMNSTHDLISGRLLTNGLDNELPGYSYEWNYPATEREYTPAALRRSGRK